MSPKYQNEFVEYIKDLLEDHINNLSIRRMFGGFGLYSDQIIFALIIENELYFKANKVASEFFQKLGSEPFTYQRKGKQIKVSYWKVTDEILEDPLLLKQCLNIAINSAAPTA